MKPVPTLQLEPHIVFISATSRPIRGDDGPTVQDTFVDVNTFPMIIFLLFSVARENQIGSFLVLEFLLPLDIIYFEPSDLELQVRGCVFGNRSPSSHPLSLVLSSWRLQIRLCSGLFGHAYCLGCLGKFFVNKLVHDEGQIDTLGHEVIDAVEYKKAS